MSLSRTRQDLRQAVDWIIDSDRVVALTGAGMSVDSGIPAFRGSQGLWERFDPMEYAHIEAFRANPARVWGMLKELDRVISAARPNPAHLALAELESLGQLEAIITQNVDALHQVAGSRRVIEFHGSHASLSCLDCGRIWAKAEVDLETLPPRCACGGALKPNVVFFGEPIPEAVLAEAVIAVSECDLMLVVGTSAQVVPASLMPALALQSGARVVEINLEATGLTNRVASLSLLGQAGLILPELVDGVRRGLRG